MSDTALMIWIHVIAATPPTLAAIAALVKATRTEKNTKQIIVSVNGRVDRLQSELDMARRALAQKDHHDSR